MTRPTSTATPFLDALSRQLADDGPEWVDRLRRAGQARFRYLGLPHTKLEEWRATNVAPIAATEFTPGLPADRPLSTDLPAAATFDLGGPRLVFVDGRYRPELSTPANGNGPWIGSLRAAADKLPAEALGLFSADDSEQAPAFTALNNALLDDAAVVVVPRGTAADQPIQLVFVSSGTEPASASNPRTVIHVGDESRAQIVETYVGLGQGLYLTNAVTDVVLGHAAHVDHTRLQLEGRGAYHISATRSRQGRDSCYSAHNIDLGGRLARHDVGAILDGEGANCQLNGLYLTDGEQHVDNHTVLDHAKPHGDSRELYKGVLADRSRGVFNGRIVVREDAQKTDAKQSNPNLLLSRGALAQTRPQLEIYADDVKCTHGATVGCLDEDAIFYLRARAIPEAEARNVLINAFAGEVLGHITLDPVRNYLVQLVADRLASGSAVVSR